MFLVLVDAQVVVHIRILDVSCLWCSRLLLELARVAETCGLGHCGHLRARAVALVDNFLIVDPN